MKSHMRTRPGIFRGAFVFSGAPGMGNNSVVKVHYALGSRKR